MSISGRDLGPTFFFAGELKYSGLPLPESAMAHVTKPQTSWPNAGGNCKIEIIGWGRKCSSLSLRDCGLD